MRWRFDWDAASAVPPPEVVLRSQGLPEGPELSTRIRRLLDEALSRCRTLVEPRALVSTIDADRFSVVYGGEGQNESETPLGLVAPRAEILALFVATVGQAVSDAIRDLFAEREPALAWMVDAVASEAADALATRAGTELTGRLRSTGALSRGAVVVPYSPGYCGWHVTGQRALFAELGPEEIGVSLNDSCLMQPLKSVSGVLVAAAPSAHVFTPAFPCCESCSTRQCEDRMRAIQA